MRFPYVHSVFDSGKVDAGTAGRRTTWRPAHWQRAREPVARRSATSTFGTCPWSRSSDSNLALWTCLPPRSLPARLCVPLPSRRWTLTRRPVSPQSFARLWRGSRNLSSLAPVREAKAAHAGELTGVVGDQGGAVAESRSGDQQVHGADREAARFQVKANPRSFLRRVGIEWNLTDSSQEFCDHGAATRGARLQCSKKDFVGNQTRYRHFARR